MTEAAVQISEEYKISLIPSQELIKIWDQCEPILFKSCKRSDGRDRPVDIFIVVLEINQVCGLFLMIQI